MYEQDMHMYDSLLQLCRINAVCQLLTVSKCNLFGKQSLNDTVFRSWSKHGAGAGKTSVGKVSACAACSMLPHLGLVPSLEPCRCSNAKLHF